MNRLYNAQKSLAESLAALESAVLRNQDFAGQSDTSGVLSETADLSATPAMLDLSQLSREVAAVEGDLETAIRMIAEVTERGPPGDSA